MASKRASESSSDRIGNMIDEVKRRREKIRSLKNPDWRTSGVLEIPNFKNITIIVEKDLYVLAYAIGFLQDFERHVKSVNSELAAENVVLGLEPIYRGFAVKDWISDIKQRIKITKLQSDENELKKLEDVLMPLLTDDQRRQIALDEASAVLNRLSV